jgi:FkbM family methyltransferase
MMKQYDALLEQRNTVIDGVAPWTWLREDTGAWDGPWHDWEDSHKHQYFQHVKKFGTVVQAGGNCGMYARLLSERFQWVYTFEPDPLNFHVLVQNCQRDNIIKLQAALGETNELIYVRRAPLINCGMHIVEEVVGGRIPQMRIDDLHLPECDLICLDVECYEIHAVRGALKTIEKFRPVISVENFNASILELLAPFGYIVQSQSSMDTVLIPGLST